MYSIIFTAALFVAIILNDVLQGRTTRVLSHTIFGVIATGLVSILWYLNYEFVSWILILIPVIALIIGYFLASSGTTVPSTSSSSTSLSTAASGLASPSGVASPSGLASLSAPITCGQYNPAGPYKAVAPSTVSLPATAPSLAQPTTAPDSTPPSTSGPAPTFKITPIAPTC